MAFTAPAAPPSASASGSDGRYTYYPMALGVMSAVFFMWGFLTCLNDILIPHLKAVFELNYAQALLIQFTFFGAYFIMSLPAGKIVAALGYKKSIVVGLIVAGIGAALFWPAAGMRLYPFFLAALFILATGITVLQVAANAYVALLGPEKTSSSRLTLAQALNSFGTFLAPFFGGFLILSNAVKSSADIAKLSAAEQVTYRAQEASTVQGPYIGLAIVLVLLAVGVYLFKLPALEETTEKADDSHHSLMDAFKTPHVFFGVLGIFFYVGGEGWIGSFMINYLQLPEIGNMSGEIAASHVAFYWGGAMVGRFIGSALLARVSPRQLLADFAVINMLLAITTMVTTTTVAVYSIVAIGLFNSIMFPTIFSLGIERMGPLTGKASRLLIMAIVGGALVPGI